LVSVVSKASSLSPEFIHCLNCWISAITAVGLCDHGLHCCLLLITVCLLSIAVVESLRSRRSFFFFFFGRFTVFFVLVFLLPLPGATRSLQLCCDHSVAITVSVFFLVLFISLLLSHALHLLL
jgi:hypothetical protein